MKENGHRPPNQFTVRLASGEHFYVTYPERVTREQAVSKVQEMFPNTARPNHPYPIYETVHLEEYDFPKPQPPFPTRDGSRKRGRPPKTAYMSEEEKKAYYQLRQEKRREETEKYRRPTIKLKGGG